MLRKISLINLLVLMCISFPELTMAAPITRQQAQQNALTFMQKCGKNITMSSLRHAPMRAQNSYELQPYYIFNIGDNSGFVIASGDDNARAVLGYSDKGTIDVNSIPEHLQWWLDEYSRQIECIQKHASTAVRIPKRTIFHPAIAPLITCHWGRSDPFNMFSPVDPETGDKCSVSDEALAMAQVMYFHRNRSVRQIPRTIPAYTTYTSQFYIDSIPAGTIIDWDNMIDNYDHYPTEVQSQAVASLMKYCCTSMKSDYVGMGIQGSVVRYKNELKKYFNYSPLSEEVKRNPNYTDEEWDQLIYSELAHSRPVMYFGSPTEDGYCPRYFVCDGYDGNGLYHFTYTFDMYSVLNVTDSDEFYLRYNHAAVINAEPLPIPATDENGIGIHFADQYVAGVCLWIADDNGDRILTESEAAAVKNPSKMIFKDSNISSFDEFKYFIGIDSIKNQMFMRNPLMSSITLPESLVAIGDDAFYGCTGLTTLTLPEKLTDIGDDAFCGCTGLSTLTLPEKLNNIGSQAFSNCESLTSITIPESVTFIGVAPFAGSGLTTAMVNCAQIPDLMFSQCNSLEKVIIEEQVNSLGKLDAANLTEVIFNAIHCKNLHGYSPFGNMVKRLTIGNLVETIPDDFMSGLSNLQTVIIPNSVTSIGQHAFSSCSGLTDLIINADTIGSSAFRNCSGIKTLNFGERVSFIGDYAFKGCSGLTNLDVNSKNRIGCDAFSGCTGLTDLVVNTPYIEQHAFENCSNLSRLSIEKDVIGIGYQAFRGCDSIIDLVWNTQHINCLQGFYPFKRLILGENIVEIPHDFCWNNTGMESLSIQGNVTKIGGFAFYGCKSLKSLYIQNHVESVEPNAFEGCSSLERLSIDVDTIKRCAFRNCIGLKSLTINGATDIGLQAFYGNSSLTKVVLGKDVNYINQDAFSSCPLLTSVISLSSFPSELNRYGFRDSYENATLYVPIDAVVAYKSTYPWNCFSNIVGLDPTLGDVNLDNEVNIADINCIVSSILNPGGDSLIDFMSDINRDGEVNIADINALIDIIL